MKETGITYKCRHLKLAAGLRMRESCTVHSPSETAWAYPVHPQAGGQGFFQKKVKAVPTIEPACHHLRHQHHHLKITSSAVENPLKPFLIPSSSSPSLLIARKARCVSRPCLLYDTTYIQIPCKTCTVPLHRMYLDLYPTLPYPAAPAAM